MPLIPEPILDEIQARTDIAELIGRYVPLKRAGRHFKALCPFHQERTPSFHVNTDKQIFHCFGCGVGGNVFSFLMQQERWTFPEAVQHLADQTGVEIPAASDDRQHGHRQALLEMLEKACRYYERALAHPTMGRPAREYLHRRGMTEQTRQRFRVGYAPEGWDHLMRAAARTRIAAASLEPAGLVVRTARGDRDRFRHRIIFPIHDARGHIVGFGGRSVAEEEPKYLNSPETAVYTKGRHLFGLSIAKSAVAKQHLAIVVEGYFDCALLWQAGIQHVVSPLGTALTPEQARLLSRYTDRVVLAFDADVAGEAATLRGIDQLLETGFHVQAAQLPAGVDPDEFVRTYGAEAFGQLIAAAANIVDFLIGCAIKHTPLRGPDDKVRVAQAILPTLVRVPNQMLRTEYVRRLASRLDLDERAVRDELGKLLRGKASGTPAPLARTDLQGAEGLLTALILDQPSRWQRVGAQVSVEELADSRLRRVLQVVCEWSGDAQQPPTPAQVISRLGEPQMSRLVSELVQRAQAEPDPEGALQKCVQRLRQDAARRTRDRLREQLRVAQQMQQHDEVTRLLTTLHALEKTSRPTAGLRAHASSTVSSMSHMQPVESMAIAEPEE